MRMLILSPHPGLRGPIPNITPLLLDALRAAGCDLWSEPWGRRRDGESPWEKVPRLAHDIARVRRRLSAGPFDVVVLQTSNEWLSLCRDIPLLIIVRKRVGTIVVHFHGGHSDRLGRRGHYAFKLASRVLFRYADGILVLSSDEVREGR